MATVRVIALLALASCTGEVPTGGGTMDAAAAIDANIDAPKLMWVDAAPGTGNGVPCRNAATPPGDGHHNTGRSCFQACHNHGFTLAGTLYTNATGNTGFSGANITLTDNNNQTINIVTQANGNFWTMQPIAFPVLVVASACPSAVRMTLASANGNCNSCHVGGTNDQMHLP